MRQVRRLNLGLGVDVGVDLDFISSTTSTIFSFPASSRVPHTAYFRVGILVLKDLGSPNSSLVFLNLIYAFTELSRPPKFAPRNTLR